MVHKNDTSLYYYSGECRARNTNHTNQIMAASPSPWKKIACPRPGGDRANSVCRLQTVYLEFLISGVWLSNECAWLSFKMGVVKWVWPFLSVNWRLVVHYSE